MWSTSLFKTGAFSIFSKLLNKKALGVIKKLSRHSEVLSNSNETTGTTQWVLGLSTTSFRILCMDHGGKMVFYVSRETFASWASLSWSSFSLRTYFISSSSLSRFFRICFLLLRALLLASESSTIFSLPFDTKASLPFWSTFGFCSCCSSDFGLG